ncbi:MAG: alpha/beta hydrolase [Mycobacterium sp.]
MDGGPTLLVGHSYGGAVITGAGRATNVVGLVYIAAFALAQGESVNSINLASSDPAPGWASVSPPSTTTCCGTARTRSTTPSAKTSTTPSRW